MQKLLIQYYTYDVFITAILTVISAISCTLPIKKHGNPQTVNVEVKPDIIQ